jgi:hypothetical protein
MTTRSYIIWGECTFPLVAVIIQFPKRGRWYTLYEGLLQLPHTRFA